MGMGENIKRIRKQHNMEQSELAKLLGISNKTVSSWETNRTEPKIGMIEKMAIIFDCEKTEIIEGEIVNDETSLTRQIMKLTAYERKIIENMIKTMNEHKES